MLGYIATITPYLIPFLNLLLAVTVFITNERRARRKEETERLQLESKQQEIGAPLPSRSKRHKR